MTLFRQILMVILLGFAANLLGVLWLQFDSTRDYLVSQLESDLENASTSLNMRLSPLIAAEDRVSVDSTLQAYFDGGFYEKVELKLLTTGEVITKENQIKVEGVPDWFVAMDFIQVPEIESVITDGWMQSGVILIKGHPGFAYKELWSSVVAMTSWISSLSIILILLAGLGVNIVLLPLERIRKKATELQERKFGSPIPLPKTLELKVVTQAINKMTDKLQEQFEEEARLHNKLKDQAFRDAVTGFGNRAFFNGQLTAWLDDSANGTIVFIELLGLEAIKNKDGWHKRDEVVQTAANYIKSTFGESIMCRLSANEFALIADGADKSKAESLLQQLSADFSSNSFSSQFCDERIFNIGAVHVNKAASNSDILSLADNAMHQARSLNEGIYYCDQATEQQNTMSRTSMKEAVEQALEQKMFGFSRQPIFSFAGEEKAEHYEVFATLDIEQIGHINANSFISVLDEFDFGASFDQKVIEQVITHISNGSDKHYAINLTASALKQQSFIEWLIRTLRSVENRHQLCFEFTEESVIYNRELIEYLCDQLSEFGVQFGVDRVGRNFSSLSYLQSIKPTYVKVDHAYTKMALNSDSEAYFVGSLCTTIHNLDIMVIATRVENQKELELLNDYHFDAYQGYVHRPERFELNK